MNIEKIKVNTFKQNQDQKKLSECLNLIEGDIRDIYEQVGQLDQMWDGEANKAFNIQFGNDYRTICEILQQIKKFLSVFDDVRNAYESCESEVGEIIRAIQI